MKRHSVLLLVALLLTGAPLSAEEDPEQDANGHPETGEPATVPPAAHGTAGRKPTAQGMTPHPALPGIDDRLAAVRKALPASGQDPIRWGAVTWAMAECHRLLDAELPDHADPGARVEALVADIQAMVHDPTLTDRHPASPPLFPVIRDLAQNPGAKGLFEVAPYRGVTPLNPRKKDADPGLNDGDSLILAYALLHPQSPARDDPHTLAALLTALNQAWCVRPSTRWAEADSLRAFLLLRTVYPNLVPKSVVAAWIAEIRSRGDKEIADSSRLFAADYQSRSWLNGDVRNTLNVGYRGLILQDPAYAAWIAHGVDLMTQTLQPDGATNYTGYQNEGAIYHDAAVGAMTWWWMFSGNARAKAFVVHSAPFYALVSHRFLCEEYTCPEQKHYYNGNRVSTPHPGYLAGDPYAVAACLSDGKWSRHLRAFFYDPTLPVVQPPDRYTLFDRNIIGPRGRYGNLDFAISTRDFSYYPGKMDPVSRTPDKGFGVTTLLGMRVMNPPGSDADRIWPMNAVAERIMNRVRIGRNDFDKGELLASSVSTSGACAAVSSRYMTSRRQGQNQNWGPVPFANTQAWIVDGERAVGLMRIAATEAVQEARMSTMFELVSGRAPWGVRKELISHGTWEHDYGDLRLVVAATSYRDFRLTYEKGGMSGNDRMRAQLRLVEEGAGTSDAPRSYAAGDAQWCLVELRPAQSPPAKDIHLLSAGDGLLAFTFTASDKVFALVQNPTEAPLAASFALPDGYGRYSLHLGTDGAVDRDKYLNRAAWERQQGQDSGNRVVPLGSAQVTFTIPPQRHIVVVGSRRDADHASGMKFYEDVFTPKP